MTAILLEITVPFCSSGSDYPKQICPNQTHEKIAHTSPTSKSQRPIAYHHLLIYMPMEMLSCSAANMNRSS